MSAGMSIIDIQVSSISFGFTLGFGFLTAWEGVKQTRAARAPLRSAYIWMIWGEIIANAAIAIQGYLLLSGAVGVTLAYLIMICKL